MKLAVIVDTFPRWSERFIARECSELLRRGVELTIYCLRAGPELPPDEEEWRGLIERRVVLPRCLVPSLRSERGLPLAVRERRERVREAIGATAYAKVRCAESLSELLRASGATHVHAHFANLPSTIGWLAAMECGLPWTLSVHARDLFVEAQLLAEKVRDARAVFCCHSNANDFLRGKFPQSQIVHMPHGLPLHLFPLRKKNPGAPPILLAAGRFVEKKGYLEFLDALATPELLEKKWGAVFLGEGPLRKKIEAKIKRLNLTRRVKIVEALCGSEFRELFAQAGLLVAPYKQAADGDVDGVANILLEAMAQGIPVVATQAGSAGRVVSDATARVIPACEPGAIQSAVTAALEQPEETAKRVKAARALIEREFDIRKNIEALLRVVR